MSIEILTPVGRIVSGHPLEANVVKDDKTKQPKLQADGTPRTSTYIGLAIAKQGETRWQDTEWGRQIELIGKTDWPNGEWMSPTFAWKITDGDSAIPNKRGKKPCEREGYPGHWIIGASTELSVLCYHAGHYQSHEIIRRKEEIKRGDYARLYLTVKGNNPSQSPGLYINPTIFELTRAGIEIIVTDGPDASEVFGATQGQLPNNAQLAPAGTAPISTPAPAPAPAPAPHPGFVTDAGTAPAPAPEVRYNVNGTGYTEAQLIASGWTQVAIAALPRV